MKCHLGIGTLLQKILDCEVNAEIDKGDLTEDEIRQQCNALNQLFGLESNLKWEIDVLLNK